MAIRQYLCAACGPFEVIRSIRSDTQELCPACGLKAEWAPTRAPAVGMSGVDAGIPNNTLDRTEYEGWQRDKWKTLEDKLDIRNAGTEPVPVSKLTRRTGSGKHR